MNSNKLEKTEKELAVTVTSIGDDIGILSASLLSLVLDESAFSNIWLVNISKVILFNN